MFSTNTDKQIKKYNKKLRAISSKAIPKAAAATLNNMAFLSKGMSVDQFEKDHVIRSNWTQRGMLYQQTKTNIPIMQMESRAGNTRDYAATLEHGGTVKPGSGSNLQIPGMRARIGKNKRKRIARGYSLDRLKGLRRMPNISGGVKRRFAAMLNIGRKRKDYGPFLVKPEDTGAGGYPSAGVYMLTGQGRGKRGGGDLEMVRKFKPTARVKGHSFVGVAGRKVGMRMDSIYVKNAKYILGKYGKDIK